MGNPVYKNVLILKYISAQNQTYNDFEIDTEAEFQDLRRRSNKTSFLQI